MDGKPCEDTAKVAIHKPRRIAEEAKPANTLILNCSLQNYEDKFLHVPYQNYSFNLREALDRPGRKSQQSA